MTLKIHPLAEIFPAMSDIEFQALKADIDAHGQHEAIWTHQGQIIDGRHRYRAMTELGMDPNIREYEFSDVLEFVLSMNLHRRHLDSAQRAMVAANLANMKQGERTDIEPSANLPKVSQSDAAAMVNVSTRAVTEANKIKKADPGLAQAVAAGGVSLHAASKVASLPAEQRQEAVAAGPVAINEAAKAVRSTDHDVAPPKLSKPSKPQGPDEMQALREKIASLEMEFQVAEELNKLLTEENAALTQAVDPEALALAQEVRNEAAQLRDQKNELMNENAQLKRQVSKLQKALDKVSGASK